MLALKHPNYITTKTIWLPFDIKINLTTNHFFTNDKWPCLSIIIDKGTFFSHILICKWKQLQNQNEDTISKRQALNADRIFLVLHSFFFSHCFLFFLFSLFLYIQRFVHQVFRYFTPEPRFYLISSRVFFQWKAQIFFSKKCKGFYMHRVNTKSIRQIQS